MTPSRYFTALIAKSFGLKLRNKRLTEASQEMSLLREAEYQLGLSVWEEIDAIPELSVEYWNLRKFTKELEACRERQLELNNELSELHHDRNAILKERSQEESQAEQEKNILMDRLQLLTDERDLIIRQARDLRRAHEGVLTKIEVISSDLDSQEVMTKAQVRSDEIKNEFQKLRMVRQDIAHAISAGDAELDQMEQKIANMQEAKKNRAADVFQKMGEINRELSAIRSASGNSETQIRQLLSEVGRYVSRLDEKDPHCAQAVKKEKTLVAVMRMLRLSISMNHKLADFK